MLLNHEQYKIKPFLINLNLIELKHYPFVINLNKCNESCNNTLSEISGRICVPIKQKK